jgi:hypothetical protein
MIYLSTVDYGIPTEAMVGLLRDLRGRLAPGGELVCLSASLLTEAGAADRIAGFARNVAAGVMHCLGLRRRQFWGWRRTAGEYAELLRRAGFGELEEGRLAGGRDRYWIRGV